jgi:hypothetical protein
MKERKKNVLNVPSNVPPVSDLTTTVKNVPPPERKDLNQNVHVNLVNMTTKVSVNHVNTHVSPVKEMPISVPDVLITENQPQIAHVQPDT